MPQSGMLRLTGFDHTRIAVSDLRRSREFYEKHLGLEVFVETTPTRSDALDVIVTPGVAVSLVMGRVCGHIVELLQYDNVEVGALPPRPSLGAGGFSVTVSDIEQAWDLADEAGITMSPRIMEVSGTRLFFIKDPDGANIELSEYADGHHEEW